MINAGTQLDVCQEGNPAAGVSFFAPAKTHNLVRLMKKTALPADEELIFWLDQVNDFHLEVRYPDFRNEFYKRCTAEFVETQFLMAS